MVHVFGRCRVWLAHRTRLAQVSDLSVDAVPEVLLQAVLEACPPSAAFAAGALWAQEVDSAAAVWWADNTAR